MLFLEPSLSVHADFDAGGLEYGGEGRDNHRFDKR
jgi:hypothetical protein